MIDWEGIYRSTFPDLVRYLHRKVWDEDRARDLAQEAFVKVLPESPERPLAFLFTVAANLARDEARNVIRRKKHLTLLKTETEHMAPVAEPPDGVLEESARQEALRVALDALSEGDREVLLLWDAGLKYEEIAKATGLSPTSVGTTLNRARKRLVAAHEGKEVSDGTRG